MNNYELIEIFGVTIIVCAQAYYFWTTRSKILLLKTIFPAGDTFQVVKLFFLKDDLKLHPKELLNNLKKYTDRVADDDAHDNSLVAGIDIITSNHYDHPVTKQIIYALNTYLIRNRGAASDFHLVKDIVDGFCGIIEDDIGQKISLPLYLGLLGTFSGIIYGLFQISGSNFSASDAMLNNAIGLLLSGVKISMVASFFGLLATIANTAFNFNKAKFILQTNKNNFYTFIKIELLPLLNQNINSTLYSLQNNLHKFNSEFQDNVVKMSGIMNKNYDTVIAQDNIFARLGDMDISQFAKANVTVLRELQLSTAQLSGFGRYMAGVNSLIENTGVLTGKVGEMVNNTEAIAAMGVKINSSVEENRQLQGFLQHHYSSLENSHALISQSVNVVNRTLEESLGNLHEFTQEKIAEIKKITLSELDNLEHKYSDKWDKLDHLSKLEPLSADLKELKIGNAGQSDRLFGKVAAIQSMIQDMKQSVYKIEQQQKENIFNKSWKWVTGKNNGVKKV